VRVLLDTNVLVSALHFRSSIPRRLLELVIRGDLGLVTSPRLLDELQEVLTEDLGWSAARALMVRRQLEDLADIVAPTEVPRICRDPDDDEVLAAATLGAVEVVVAGDKDLPVLERHGDVEIVSPAHFLRRPG
jgi:putative PIN family toxin of toxin-antitoxin system